MNKIYFYRKFIVLLLFALLYGCEESMPPLSVNLFDPDSKYFIGNPPGNISIESLGRTIVKISWKDNSSFEKGYIIERTNLNTNETRMFYTGANENYYIDNELDIYGKYKYRVATKTNTDYFKFNDSITIQYNPYFRLDSFNGYDFAEISPNSSRCCAQYGDGGLDIYNITEGSVKYLLKSNLSTYRANKFSKDGSIIAFSGMDRVGYYIINSNKTVNLRVSSLIDSWALVDISNDNKYLTNFRGDHKIEVWDLARNISRSFQFPYDISLQGLCFSPGNRFIAGKDGSSIYLWDFSTFNLYCKINAGGSYAYPWCFSDNGNTLIFYDGNSKNICFWDINSKSTVCEVPDSNCTGLRLIRGGEFLEVFETGNNRTSIVLRQMKDGKPLAPLTLFTSKSDPLYKGASIADNGDVLVYESSGRSITILRFKDNWKVVN